MEEPRAPVTHRHGAVKSPDPGAGDDIICT